ncbi:MAG: TRAP transporter substrate-binding protein [Burkholderiales bacterium]
MSTQTPLHGIRLILALVIGTLSLGAIAQTKIDIAIFHPERNAWSVTFKWWLDEVDKATDGRVKFNPAYAGSLVTANETLKSVRDGAVPAGFTSAAAMSGSIPSLAYLESIGGMPGDVQKFADAVAALRPTLDEEFRKQGVEYLWPQGSGHLIVLCRDRLMKNIADWKARKVRTAGRWQGEQLLAIGASPVSTDMSEQYLALQNRTIDCALSVAVLASALKLYEVAPKITVLGMPVNLSFYLVNRAIWEKISPDDRAAIKRLGAEAEKRSAQYLNEVQLEAQAQMKTQKAEIYTLTADEIAAFRKGIEPGFLKMDAQGGAAGKQVADTVKRFW